MKAERERHTWDNGLGGHQWAHSSTTDLVHWEHHPLAIPLGKPGEVDSGSVCTGLVFEHDGVFCAFYAGRVRNEDGSATQHVCLATSQDCVRFAKRPDNSDTGDLQWGGNAVFRELVQAEDGTLWTKFPPEMIPAAASSATWSCERWKGSEPISLPRPDRTSPGGRSSSVSGQGSTRLAA